MISVKIEDPEVILDRSLAQAGKGIALLVLGNVRDGKAALTQACEELVALLGETPYIVDQIGSFSDAEESAMFGDEALNKANEEIDNERYEEELKNAYELLAGCVSILNHLEFDNALAGHA